MKRRWKYVGFKKLVGSEKDVITSMNTQTSNIGRKILENIEEAKRNRTITKRKAKKTAHTFISPAQIRITWLKRRSKVEKVEKALIKDEIKKRS